MLPVTPIIARQDPVWNARGRVMASKSRLVVHPDYDADAAASEVAFVKSTCIVRDKCPSSMCSAPMEAIWQPHVAA